jgi:hypothetical protein
MKKNLKKIFTLLLVVSLVTGCGCTKKENNVTGENNAIDDNNKEQTVVDDQIFEGLEFVNVGVSDGVIKTIVINNTGFVYEGSKFSMKVMDSNGNVLIETTDEVKTKMENGTTQTIETKVDIDLSEAASIEYSIVK